MKNVIGFLIVLCFASSCRQGSSQETQKSNSSKEETVQETSLRLSWIPSCSSAGDFLGMRDYAEKNRLNLKIDIGGPGLDPIKLVTSGANTFGQAGADLVLIANDKGADLVIIGLVNYNSPGVWLAKKSANINTIADIKGKRVGEFAGSDMIYLYEVFLKKTGLIRNKDFTPVRIPFDFKNFITQDECDLRPVFIYNEPSDLEVRNIDYTLIEPKNFGIQFKGLCYFCKRETIENDPQLVQKFINTMEDGWTEATKNPEKAVQCLKEKDNTINEKKELLAMRKASSYFQGYQGKLLYTDLASWKVMTSDLKSLGFLKSSPNLDKSINLSFIEKYYDINGLKKVNVSNN